MKLSKTFFGYVIPAIFSFALSGVYAIVDGFFVGNTIGDAGLSAINIAYPLVALMQAAGTGIGMGGAVYYSINKAEGNESRARNFIAASWWLLLFASVVFSFAVYFFRVPLLVALGADGKILTLGSEYMRIIAIGSVLQILGTGLVPFLRNYGGSLWAMIAMIGGFIVNIIFDYLYVWVWNQGMTGAAVATIIGQGVTMVVAISYTVYKRNFALKISHRKMAEFSKAIFKVGLAPFGLALTPNISLMIINRFSAIYGGEKAIATYACISYIVCIIYLILQGVGDGSQPLMSRYYGEKNSAALKQIDKLAYTFAIFLALIGCAVMFAVKNKVGVLFGSSDEVNSEIAKIMPIFLVSVPFVAIVRVATASFYATERSGMSYILTFAEPLLMLVLMLILPPLFGSQMMVWWSTVLARIISAVVAVMIIIKSNRKTS